MLLVLVVQKSLTILHGESNKLASRSRFACKQPFFENLLPVVEFVTMVSFFSLGFVIALVTAGATRMDRSEEVQVGMGRVKNVI